MDIIAFAAAAAIMGAIITALLAVYEGSASPRGSLERRLGNLLAESTGFEVAAADFGALRQTRTGSLPFIGALLQGKEWTAETAARLESADLRLTVSEFVGLRVFLGLILGTLMILVLGSSLVGVLPAILLGFIGYKLPNFYVNFQRDKRIRKLNEQLPDALSMLANSLKAGFGLMQALDLASKELTHPLATELRRALNDINVGSSSEEALTAMAERSGSEDVDIVITAMLVQQSTGGNLAEILENVAHTMRERIRIRGEIKTLTTQQVFTGFIIGALPIVIGLLISLVNPTYITPLFTETAGNVMLGGAAVLEFFGVMLIKRILAIEV
jgi:tight adherence protein B